MRQRSVDAVLATPGAALATDTDEWPALRASHLNALHRGSLVTDAWTAASEQTLAVSLTQDITPEQPPKSDANVYQLPKKK